MLSCPYKAKAGMMCMSSCNTVGDAVTVLVKVKERHEYVCIVHVTLVRLMPMCVWVMRVYKCVCVCIYAPMCTYYVCMHMYIYECSHAHQNTHTHTHTHTHTYMSKSGRRLRANGAAPVCTCTYKLLSSSGFHSTPRNGREKSYISENCDVLLYGYINANMHTNTHVFILVHVCDVCYMYSHLHAYAMHAIWDSLNVCLSRHVCDLELRHTQNRANAETYTKARECRDIHKSARTQAD